MYVSNIIDIILGLETVHFCGAMRVALVTKQFSIKHLYTGRYQAINLYATMDDKEMTFSLSLWTVISEMQRFILEVDPFFVIFGEFWGIFCALWSIPISTYCGQVFGGSISRNLSVSNPVYVVSIIYASMQKPIIIASFVCAMISTYPPP